MTDKALTTKFTPQIAPTPLLRWFQWEPDNSTAFKSKRRNDGNGEHRLVTELQALGFDASSVVNDCYDIATEFGKFEVKAPDSGGRIITAGLGHAAVSSLIRDCSYIVRVAERTFGMGDGEFMAKLRQVEDRISQGTMSADTFGHIATLLEILNTVIDIDPLVSSAHEWIIDPAVFESDCSCVFPSECITADFVAFVCEEGYALIGTGDIDSLLKFRGDVWNGKPKFFCDQITPRNRKANLKKSTATKSDKIEAIEKLKAKQRKRKDNGD